jgi:hypothetical protein
LDDVFVFLCEADTATVPSSPLFLTATDINDHTRGAYKILHVRVYLKTSRLVHKTLTDIAGSSEPSPVMETTIPSSPSPKKYHKFSLETVEPRHHSIFPQSISTS